MKWWSVNALKIWIFIALAFGGVMFYLDQPFPANVAFLVTGGLVATVTQLVSDSRKREERRLLLAGSVYVELANRVARCLFDFEAPWERFMDAKTIDPREMSVVRLRKFMPVRPEIYPASAGNLSMFGPKASAAVIRFYTHFEILRGDIEIVASYCERKGLEFALPNHVAFLADRYHRTLLPGLQALVALSPLVPDSEVIDAEAIRSLDDLVPGHPRSTLSLRQRLEHYVP